AFIITINALPSVYDLKAEQKNLRNFQQFVIHFISPTNFVNHYAEWSLITHAGHDLYGDEFDTLFDLLSLNSGDKINQAVNILNDLLNEISALPGDYDDQYHTLVMEAVEKIKLL
ncbi:hypothetical protein BpHYR1_051874, partial [Brachionus plicatilis]